MGHNKILAQVMTWGTAFAWILLWEVILPVVPEMLQCTGVVQTRSGQLRGKVVKSSDDQVVEAYLGIPFAAPPIGELRFKRPLPVQPWDGILDADVISDDCFQKPIPLQKHVSFSKPFTNNPPYTEDCLKLNIWVPNGVKKERRLPVIVWIYGGGFSRGGTKSTLYDGTELASQENVIIVAPNYRVASFGFLYLDHPDAPGNMGLLDQTEALKWVQENIGFFGGDSNLVTLMGHSAGSISVTFHFLSPLSQNLFRRGIVQSGTPNPGYGFADKEDALEQARKLAANTGCPWEDKKALVQCLRELSPEELIDNEPQGHFDHVYTFTPVNDNYFLTSTPWSSILKGEFKKADLLIGTTKDEATMFLASFSPIVFNPIKIRSKITPITYTKALPPMMNLTQISRAIIHAMYFKPGYNDQQSSLSATIRLVSDTVFNCPSEFVEHFFSKAENNIYKYFFVHRTAKTSFPKWYGVHHGSDMFYVTGDPLSHPGNYTVSEIIFSKRIMRYWANFARTGTPNLSPGGKSVSVSWPKYSHERKEYLILAPDTTSTGQFLKTAKCFVWIKAIAFIEQIDESCTANLTYLGQPNQ